MTRQGEISKVTSKIQRSNYMTFLGKVGSMTKRPEVAWERSDVLVNAPLKNVPVKKIKTRTDAWKPSRQEHGRLWKVLTGEPVQKKRAFLRQKERRKAGPKVVALSQKARAIRNFRQEMGPRRRKIPTLSEFKEISVRVCRHR